MSNLSKLRIEFGALADPLGEQLRAKGFDVSDDEMAEFEKDREALLRLSVRRLITPGESAAAFRRLASLIAACVETE